MEELHPCPGCRSEAVSRNGHTRHGKQNYKCRDCRRQFVLDPQWQALSEAQQGLMDRMLLERISFAGIARVLQRSEDGIHRYVNRKTNQVKLQVEVSAKPKKRLGSTPTLGVLIPQLCRVHVIVQSPKRVDSRATLNALTAPCASEGLA